MCLLTDTPHNFGPAHIVLNGLQSVSLQLGKGGRSQCAFMWLAIELCCISAPVKYLLTEPSSQVYMAISSATI